MNGIDWSRLIELQKMAHTLEFYVMPNNDVILLIKESDLPDRQSFQSVNEAIGFLKGIEYQRKISSVTDP